MQVKVHFVGLIRHHTRDSEKTYELPEGATAGELLLVVGRDYGDRLPDHMWNAEEETFHHTVQAAHKGSPGMPQEEQLKDGDDIYIFSRMAGG